MKDSERQENERLKITTNRAGTTDECVDVRKKKKKVHSCEKEEKEEKSIFPLSLSLKPALSNHLLHLLNCFILASCCRCHTPTLIPLISRMLMRRALNPPLYGSASPKGRAGAPRSKETPGCERRRREASAPFLHPTVGQKLLY